MSDGGYDAFDDPYCYRGTFTLKNRLGLRDPGQLEQFELEMSTTRANEPLPAGRFDPLHYRRVHRHLFQDVYRWAGRYRTVRISKAGNVFCYPEHIPAQIEGLFAELHASGCLNTPEPDAFVVAAVRFLGELNAIHPFREGNGRAQLAFMDLIGVEAGYPFDFSRIQPGSFMPAMIASFHGELAPLAAELGELIV